MYYRISAVILLAFVFLYSSTPAQTIDKLPTETAPTKSLISNVNIVDVEKGKLLKNMDVLIQGPTILDIRKHQKLSKDTKELNVIKADGKYLMPGLVDCHTHILFADELELYLRYGVTTVFSLGGPKNVLAYRDSISEGKLVGPNIYAGQMMDAITQDYGGIIFNKAIKSVADVRPAMTNIKTENWDFIKVYNSLTTSEFDEIIKIAKENGIPVFGHGVREPGMEHILSKGMAMVAHGEEYLYTVFKDSLDERKIPEAVAMTKKYGAFVCPNLSTFLTLSKQWGDSLNFSRMVNEPGDLKEHLNPFILNSWRTNNPYIHKNGSISSMYDFLKKLTNAMYKAGVPLVAGTDSPIIPGCFPGYSIINDLQLLTNAGLSNADALKTATLVPQQFVQKNMKHPAKFGLIKKGYRADILLLNENPLDNIQNLRTVSEVMVRGEWIKKGAKE